MASLTTELIEVLRQEDKIYDEFIPLCNSKTKYIVANDVEAVKKQSEEEQVILDKLLAYEKKRRRILRDISTVMNVEYADLKISHIIEMLDIQPVEQKELSTLHDSLKSKINKAMQINNHNTSLIKQSLDMIEFNMNFIKSTWMSVGNNGYDDIARPVDDKLDEPITRMFDARQ